MNTYFHSVRLDEEKCMGCTNCIKRCPTQAIRVRSGKAHIISERCIDCGECIRVCPHHAKYSHRDSMNRIIEFKYRVALPAPSLYGQFNNLDDIGYVITALKMLGFDEVFEVARGAELVSDATRKYIAEHDMPRPVISSACPAVCRLIRVCFPHLVPHVLPLNSPMETAALIARSEAQAKRDSTLRISEYFYHAVPREDNRRQAAHLPAGVECRRRDSDEGYISRAFEADEPPRAPEDACKSGLMGVNWAASGGESAALLKDKYLAADGIENVIKVLEEIEDEKLDRLDFVELNACSGGCVGGSLTAENPYVAKARIQQLRRYLPVAANHLAGDEVPETMSWQRPLEGSSVLKLADNVSDAMAMMSKMTEIIARLPGLDCGTCGAPTCRALAEDIVRGNATLHDCVFAMRDELAGTDMQEYIPAPFRSTGKRRRRSDRRGYKRKAGAQSSLRKRRLALARGHGRLLRRPSELGHVPRKGGGRVDDRHGQCQLHRRGGARGHSLHYFNGVRAPR